MIGTRYGAKSINNAWKILYDEKKDLFRKGALNDLHKDSSTMCILDDYGYIEKIVGSIPGDLLLDQMGQMLTGMIAAPSTLSNDQVIKLVSGATKTFASWHGSAGYMFFNTTVTNGIFVRLGLGNVAPTRADFTIGTPCTTAPENAAQPLTGNGAYSSPNCSYAGQIGPFGATENITESLVTVRATATDATNGNEFAIARYLYAVSLSVPISKTVSYANTLGI